MKPKDVIFGTLLGIASCKTVETGTEIVEPESNVPEMVAEHEAVEEHRKQTWTDIYALHGKKEELEIELGRRLKGSGMRKKCEECFASPEIVGCARETAKKSAAVISVGLAVLVELAVKSDGRCPMFDQPPERRKDCSKRLTRDEKKWEEILLKYYRSSIGCTWKQISCLDSMPD